MQRNKAIYTIAEGQCAIIKTRMLNWSQRFSILVFLDSNNYRDPYSRFECLGGFGTGHVVTERDGMEGASAFHEEHKDWLFGHINYDYKNRLERGLKSRHEAVSGFDDICFFQPEIVCYITTDKAELVIETLTTDPDGVYREIMNTSAEIDETVPIVSFQQTTLREKYLQNIDSLRSHIKEGDCYEINYCNEYHAEGVTLQPLNVFSKLNGLSHAPFAAYYRNGSAYLMCASPERYIRKQGYELLSQPIKGTARRDKDPETDETIKQSLSNSIKDKAENVMITDLVRNDLARSCVPGSVKVKELFGIYSFPQVHQMISTVAGRMKEHALLMDGVRYSFPMGSMTGAPKIKVMQLVEQYEDKRRELYSGTIGYISPEGNYDFNVVIRSLFYNSATLYLSYQAGGAITYDSSAEGEWDEMRLKAWAMERIFNADS